jgi:glycosyltransferase involved in cell wall biosynthesis
MREMGTPNPELSVILVAGDRRRRVERVLEAIAAQTFAGELETVVVDVTGDEASPLRFPDDLRMVLLALPRETTWGEARAAGLRRATAPVVAYIEEHCYPSHGWAEALMEAHREPWAAVGYAFTNANPESYPARTAMMLDYGRWAHPARGGAATLLPYNNVSYKREAIVSLGDLEQSLDSDFHALGALARKGMSLAIEPRALVAHENFDRVAPFLRSHYHYCRLLAARRADLGNWSHARRALYVLATPFVAPPIYAGRLFGSLRGRRTLAGPMLTTLPVLVVKSIVAAIGETAGYALGPGNSVHGMKHYEIHAERASLR